MSQFYLPKNYFSLLSTLGISALLISIFLVHRQLLGSPSFPNHLKKIWKEGELNLSPLTPQARPWLLWKLELPLKCFNFHLVDSKKELVASTANNKNCFALLLDNV